jgi:hypothetical protein
MLHVDVITSFIWTRDFKNKAAANGSGPVIFTSSLIYGFQ